MLHLLAALVIFLNHSSHPGRKGPGMLQEGLSQQGDRFCVCGQTTGLIAVRIEMIRQDPDRAREIGPEGVGPGGGERAADTDRFLDGGERVLAPAEIGQPDGQVVQRRCEIGPEGVGPGGGERAPDSRPPPRWRRARPRAGRDRTAGWTGCSAPLRDRAGRRRAGRRRARGRYRPPPRWRRARPRAGRERTAGWTGCSATMRDRAGRRRVGRRRAGGGCRPPPGWRPAPPRAGRDRTAGWTGCSATLRDRAGRRRAGRRRARR